MRKKKTAKKKSIVVGIQKRTVATSYLECFKILDQLRKIRFLNLFFKLASRQTQNEP